MISVMKKPTFKVLTKPGSNQQADLANANARPAKTTAAATSATSKPDASAWRALAIVGVIVLVAAAGAAFIWHRHQADEAAKNRVFQVDKAKFAQLEPEMQTAYDAMIAAAGKPDKHGESKNCSHVSLKYAQGQLNCGIAYNFIYGVDDIGQAYDLSAKLNGVLDGGGIFKLDKASSVDALDLKSNRTQTIRMKANEPTQSNCEFAFTFNTSSLELYKGIDHKYVNDFFFTCNRDTAKPVYTLAE